jgi:hypothetical protein
MRKYTDDQLFDILDRYDNSSSEYTIASIFTEDRANRDNFYKNSIGFWTQVDSPPDEEPDYESYSGSEYWYDWDGVYRRSDHWGSKVSTCSWYLGELNKGIDNFKNIGYHQRYGCETFDEPVTGFIRWDDLKAKGWIELYSDDERYDEDDAQFYLYGFTFKDDAWDTNY